MAGTKTAAAGTKSFGATLDKRQVLTTVEHFFQAFQKCITQKGALSASMLEPYLSKNFQLTSNDQIIARSLSDYMNRIAHFQKKFSHLEIAGPTADPILEGNRICIPYSIECTTTNGKKYEVLIIGVGTIEDNKIKSWTQVTHEKGSGAQWDAYILKVCGSAGYRILLIEDIDGSRT